MNKAFTESKTITLDEFYCLESDGDNGVVLVFSETRQRDKVVKENGKVVKTGQKEDYIFEDKTYHTRVGQALKYYVQKSLNNLSTLDEIIQKEEKIFSIIEKIDNTFKQF